MRTEIDREVPQASIAQFQRVHFGHLLHEARPLEQPGSLCRVNGRSDARRDPPPGFHVRFQKCGAHPGEGKTGRKRGLKPAARPQRAATQDQCAWKVICPVKRHEGGDPGKSPVCEMPSTLVACQSAVPASQNGGWIKPDMPGWGRQQKADPQRFAGRAGFQQGPTLGKLLCHMHQQLVAVSDQPRCTIPRPSPGVAIEGFWLRHAAVRAFHAMQSP